ncbi:MAG: MBL fold metallo-hydrolase, partial [Candidatus Binatia bacterium]
MVYGRRGGGLRMAPGARLELRHRDPTVTYAVDCRMLFMGDRIRLVPRAYQEILHWFSSGAAGYRLFEKLAGSAEIQQFYEVGCRDGNVSVTLRDSIFREPGPIGDLDLVVEVSDGRRSFTAPLPVARLKALGSLLPALCGSHDAEAISARVRAGLTPPEADWALDLFHSLASNGFITDDPRRAEVFRSPPARSRVMLLAHSSLLVQSPKGALLVDPVLRLDQGLRAEAFDVVRLRLDAILCSHGHWDHCDLQTLSWFDKDTPILVPRNRRPTVFNPPIAPALARLGFTDVREVDHWQPIRVGDFEVVPVPFHGEQDEPGEEIDHYTYVIRTEGLCLYGGVDGYRDTFGTMAPVLERVRRLYRPD